MFSNVNTYVCMYKYVQVPILLTWMMIILIKYNFHLKCFSIIRTPASPITTDNRQATALKSYCSLKTHLRNTNKPVQRERGKCFLESTREGTTGLPPHKKSCVLGTVQMASRTLNYWFLILSFGSMWNIQYWQLGLETIRRNRIDCSVVNYSRVCAPPLRLRSISPLQSFQAVHITDYQSWCNHS
jgi:hypothetical protein